MIYAVIDTNVLVAALLSRHSDSATVQVVSAISEKGLRPLYNHEIIAEYKEVLSRPKFEFPTKAIASILNKIQMSGMASYRTKHVQGSTWKNIRWVTTKDAQ